MVATPTDSAYLRTLFSRNARTYDPVNRLISLGQVGRWRRELIRLAGIPADGRVLDAFAGPGSLGLLALPRLGPAGELVLADLSPAMLARAEAALYRAGAGPGAGPPKGERGAPRVVTTVVDVLDPTVGLGRYDVVLLGFGLRYVPDVLPALRRLGGLLADDGRLAVLEFTRPEDPPTWTLAANVYFLRVLPRLAAGLAGDPELYAYLAQSARDFLTPEGLGRALWQAGLVPLRSRVYLGGRVSLVVAAAAAAVRQTASASAGCGAPAGCGVRT